jgi:uroporphyrinogen-III synthase
MRMVLRPDSAGRRLLARHRKYGWALHVCVWTTYTPAGGHSRSVKTIILVLAARKAAS